MRNRSLINPCISRESYSPEFRESYSDVSIDENGRKTTSLRYRALTPIPIESLPSADTFSISSLIETGNINNLRVVSLRDVSSPEESSFIAEQMFEQISSNIDKNNTDKKDK